MKRFNGSLWLTGYNMPISIPLAKKNIAPAAKPTRGTRVRSKEIIFFLSQLTMMLEVGISMSRSIETIAHQVSNAGFKSVLLSMVRSLEEGQQLSDVMHAYPRVFNPVYVNIIESGETGGILTRVLGNIIEIQEKNQQVLNQLKTAMIYPAVLVAMALIVTVFALVGILPKIMIFFEGKFALLPVTTRALMGLSHILSQYWWACLLGAGIIVSLAYAYFGSATGRTHRDWLLIHIPVVSRISNNIYTGLFLRIVGNMLDSGVSLKEALGISAKSTGNIYYQQFVQGLHKNIQEGQKFSRGFSENNLIQDSVKQMIYVGEEAGKLPLVMLRLARFYDSENEQDFKKITAFIEPIAMVFIGFVVWVLVSSIILPMFRLASAIN